MGIVCSESFAYLQEGANKVGQSHGHLGFVLELLLGAEADIAAQNQILRMEAVKGRTELISILK